MKWQTYLIALFVILLAGELVAAQVEVITVNDQSAVFTVSNVTLVDRGDGRRALTVAATGITGEGEVQLQYSIGVVDKNRSCKGKIRYTRNVDADRDGVATLQVYLRGIEDGDDILIIPLGINGEETEGQRRIIENTIGPEDTCLQMCNAMLAECHFNCSPSQVCYFCDAPTCALMDCYCAPIPECPGPYRLYP